MFATDMRRGYGLWRRGFILLRLFEAGVSWKMVTATVDAVSDVQDPQGPGHIAWLSGLPSRGFQPVAADLRLRRGIWSSAPCTRSHPGCGPAWPARWEEAADDGEGHFAELASIGLPV